MLLPRLTKANFESYLSYVFAAIDYNTRTVISVLVTRQLFQNFSVAHQVTASCAKIKRIRNLQFSDKIIAANICARSQYKCSNFCLSNAMLRIALD